MSLPIALRWLNIPAIFFCFCALWAPSLVSAQTNSTEHPAAILKEHRQKILQLSSDNEALTFHKNAFSKYPPLEHSASRRTPSKTNKTTDSISVEKQGTITTFWAALATIGIIQEFREAAESPLSDHHLLGTVLSDTQQEWLTSKPSLVELKAFLEFQQKLAVSPPQDPETLLPENEYAQFTNFYEQSHSTTNNQSWINLFTDLGFQGIEIKLHEYWQQQEQPTQQPISDAHKQAYIHQYVASKILPLLQTHLLILAIEVEGEAHEIAWSSWYAIQQWQQQEQSDYAMIRLCGTWKWIIHNHQNHGDHKSTMEFIPPGQETAPQVQPTTILIHGDTVYLKWTFAQGIQEDSLLLSNHDTRLEGTFTNSLGPYGSISGQRISKCKNK